MQLDIRKPGGAQWGAVAIDVPIDLPNGHEFVSAPEVFETEEDGGIFFTYYKTGDIPPGYALRPVEGFTAYGQNVDLRGATRNSRA